MKETKKKRRKKRFNIKITINFFIYFTL